jgi:hypothetical protein
LPRGYHENAQTCQIILIWNSRGAWGLAQK